MAWLRHPWARLALALPARTLFCWALCSCALSCALSCATPTTIVELPACADRVEVTGQADRIAPTRFQLDHGLELPLTRSVLTFQSGSRVQTVELVNTQPEPIRFFVGAASAVVGGVLLASASADVAAGASLFTDRPFYSTLGGSALVVLGAGALLTGWHPSQRYVSFPAACGPDDAASTGPRVNDRGDTATR